MAIGISTHDDHDVVEYTTRSMANSVSHQGVREGHHDFCSTNNDHDVSIQQGGNKSSQKMGTTTKAPNRLVPNHDIVANVARKQEAIKILARVDNRLLMGTPLGPTTTTKTTTKRKASSNKRSRRRGGDQTNAERSHFLRILRFHGL